MKKLIIICEGPTEKFFCKHLLEEHFKSLGIELEYPLISHSNGGIVKWKYLKPQIENSLIDESCYVTTFIDYYGIESHHAFPEWDTAHEESDKSRRMNILQEGMHADLSEEIKGRFIPYIQLHEFEALVFSNYAAFEDYYEEREANFVKLAEVCMQNPNPETINDSPMTAPSKRLITHIKRYNKIAHGVDLCKSIGLKTIREKCPRFNEWITKLEII